MAITSRVNLVRGTLRKLGLYEEGAFTATSATALTIASWPFKTNRANASAQTHIGKEVYVYTGTAPSPNPNGVSNYVPSTGILTPAFDYTTTPGSTASFFLIGGGVAYNDAVEALNRALGLMRYRTVVPITLVPDGDMDTSGTADWTDVGTVTPSKVTSTGNVQRGSQALRLLNGAASSGSRTASIAVDPTNAQHYYLQANVRAAVGTARLQAYDATNSAAIDAETYANAGWGRLSLSFTLPATCETLQVRLIGDGASDDIYWDDVVLLRRGAMEVPLPTWVTDRSHVRRVLQSRANLLQVDREDMVEVWAEIEADESNPLSQFRVRVDSISGPLYLDALRPFDTLSTDSATTHADRQWAENYGALELCREMVMRPGDQSRWVARLRGLEPLVLRWNQIEMGGPVVRRQFPERTGLPALTY